MESIARQYLITVSSEREENLLNKDPNGEKIKDLKRDIHKGFKAIHKSLAVPEHDNHSHTGFGADGQNESE